MKKEELNNYSQDELRAILLRLSTEMKKRKAKSINQREELKDDFGRSICLPNKVVLTSYKNEQVWLKVVSVNPTNFHGMIVGLNEKPKLFNGKPKEIWRKFSQIERVK